MFQHIRISVVYSKGWLSRTEQCDLWRYFPTDSYHTHLKSTNSTPALFHHGFSGPRRLCWHAAGCVWLEPTEVNVTAVFWVTPSVCDRPARPGCLWHIQWYPTDLYLGPVQVLLSTAHPLKAPLTFFHEWFFSCSLLGHYSVIVYLVRYCLCHGLVAGNSSGWWEPVDWGVTLFYEQHYF